MRTLRFPLVVQASQPARRQRPFSKRVALMTAVYAAILAIASLGGSNAMKEMLPAQQEASNQWAFCPGSA